MFGTNARLAYGPQIQRHTCVCKLLTELKLFTVCTERVRSPYTEHAASGLPNPTLLEGEVRCIQATEQQSENGSRVFTSSMLNKMYYLVANPEDRVSRDVAHFQMVYQFIAVHQGNTI